MLGHLVAYLQKILLIMKKKNDNNQNIIYLTQIQTQKIIYQIYLKIKI